MQQLDMLEFDISKAHKLVREQRASGNDVRWDGWDIVFFREADHGINSVDGAFRNGRWGFENRVIVNSEGKWLVDPRNVRRVRRAGPRR